MLRSAAGSAKPSRSGTSSIDRLRRRTTAKPSSSRRRSSGPLLDQRRKTSERENEQGAPAAYFVPRCVLLSGWRTGTTATAWAACSSSRQTQSRRGLPTVISIAQFSVLPGWDLTETVRPSLAHMEEGTTTPSAATVSSRIDPPAHIGNGHEIGTASGFAIE